MLKEGFYVKRNFLYWKKAFMLETTYLIDSVAHTFSFPMNFLSPKTQTYCDMFTRFLWRPE